jgi:hypothetical protein
VSTLARSQTPDELLTEIVDQILMRHIRPTRQPATPERNWRREASLRRIAESMRKINFVHDGENAHILPS